MYSIKALSSRPCYLRVTFHDKIVSENAGFQFREIMNLYVPFWQRENIDFFRSENKFLHLFTNLSKIKHSRIEKKKYSD